MSIPIFDTEMDHKGTKASRRALMSLLFVSSCLPFLHTAEVDLARLPAAASRPIDFAADIKPIFETSCLRCHGAERPKSGFSLTTREAVLKGGDEGISVIPGDSANSSLIHYVARLVPEMEMPPAGKGEPLSPEQIGVLRAWIDQGVNWEATTKYSTYFSFTPAVRWVTVSGNAGRFQEHQWVRKGVSAGLSDFRVTEQRTNDVSILAEGRALTDDYRVTLDIRKPRLGFVRMGFEQYRRYYDDHGPFYPFQGRGFATQSPYIFSLDQNLYLDI
jgi:mono/diheme cytochrome c family protein